MGSPSDVELHSTFNKIVKKSTKHNTYKFALARFLLERSREAKGGGVLEVGYADVAESSGIIGRTRASQSCAKVPPTAFPSRYR